MRGSRRREVGTPASRPAAGRTRTEADFLAHFQAVIAAGPTATCWHVVADNLETHRFKLPGRSPGGIRRSKGDSMDFRLTEEERAMRDLARDFADRHIRPGLLEREWEMDAEKRMPWDIVDAGSAAGLRTLTVPARYGGPDPKPSLLARVLIMEELAAADPGVANTFAHSFKDPEQIEEFGTDEQRDWFFPQFMADPRYLTSTASSEPNHGSDWALPYNGTHFDTTAVLDGEEWVINGEKSCISHGMVSKLIILYACTDPTKSISDGTTCFLVPRG
ncbi:MAG: acyl-CoA dehydrogenase family protein, partial [Chloroflexi bacterium]|nr:acyl-CoA dehydrogenase family protein [Chloroflexota bacterium]